MAETSTGITLTQVTRIGRLGVKVGAVTIVALLVGRTLINSLVAYWIATHPPAPPPPTVGFGLLPPIRFPAQDDSGKPESYILETAQGTVPLFSDRAKVFFMPQSAPSLLADQQAKQIAAQLGYVFAPQTLDTRTYRWTKSQPFESVLQMDIQNFYMSLDSQFLTRPELLAKGKLPTDSQAVDRVKTLLSTVQLLPPDVATATGRVTYLKSIGNQLQSAVSLSDADFIQVDLTRTAIDTAYPMFTPEGLVGTIQAIVSGALNGQQSVVQFRFRHQSVDYTQVETYPLRTSQAAWKLMQSGEGYIAQKGTQDQAVIRDVMLGYFDSFEEQAYLQPVYVFLGDAGFIGYVPALDPKYVQNGAVAK